MNVQLTAKELSSIEDQLYHEYTVIQKYRSYAENCTDQALAAKCTQFADKHQGHFNTLLSQLQ